jgi:hypothetical protein
MVTQTEDFEDASILFSPTGAWDRSSSLAHTGVYSYHGNSYNIAHFQIPDGASTVSFWYRGSATAVSQFNVKLDATTVILSQTANVNTWTQVTADCAGCSTLDLYPPGASYDSYIDDLSFTTPQSPPPFANRPLRIWRIH